MKKLYYFYFLIIPSIFISCATISNNNNPPYSYPDKLIKTISVGSGPVYVKTSKDGNYIYVSNNFSRSISVIKQSDRFKASWRIFKRSND